MYHTMKENMEWQVMFEVCSFIQRTTRDIPVQWSVGQDSLDIGTNDLGNLGQLDGLESHAY